MKNLYVTEGSKYTKHIEGDVWEEQGKLWTIKNGIKRTVSKMDDARKELYAPLACPDCGKAMNHPYDEKAWAVHKTCFECVIDNDHKLMKEGKWEQYEKDVMLKNAQAFVKDFEAYMDDYMKEDVSSSNVTENGLVERWKNVDQDHLNNIKKQGIEKLEQNIKEIQEK